MERRKSIKEELVYLKTIRADLKRLSQYAVSRQIDPHSLETKLNNKSLFELYHGSDEEIPLEITLSQWHIIVHAIETQINTQVTLRGAPYVVRT